MAIVKKLIVLHHFVNFGHRHYQGGGREPLRALKDETTGLGPGGHSLEAGKPQSGGVIIIFHVGKHPHPSRPATAASGGHVKKASVCVKLWLAGIYFLVHAIFVASKLWIWQKHLKIVELKLVSCQFLLKLYAWRSDTALHIYIFLHAFHYNDPWRGTHTSTPETHLTLGSKVSTVPALSR